MSKWSDNYSDLSVIESILRKRLHTRSQQENFDDGIQQGLYRAWKDQQAGTFTEMHVINRAENWARAYFQKPWLPLGHTRASGNGGFSDEGVCLLPIAELADDEDVSDKLARATMVCEEDEIVTRLCVETLLAGLPAGHSKVLRMRFMEDASLDSLGRMTNPCDKIPGRKGAKLVKAALMAAYEALGED